MREESSGSVECSNPVVEPEVSRRLRASRHRRIDVSLYMQSVKGPTVDAQLEYVHGNPVLRDFYPLCSNEHNVQG